MVLHVHVEKGEDRVDEDGAGVFAVVVGVFAKAGVLGEAEELVQPAAVEAGQEDEHHGQEAADGDGPGGDGQEDGDVDAAGQIHLGQLAFGHEIADVVTGAAGGVADDAPDFGWAAAEVEEVHQDFEQVGWARDLDFGVAADDVGVGMVAGVAPAPHDCFAQGEEGVEVVEGFVKPVGLEGCAVAAFVPGGVGGGVDGAVDEEGWDGPPCAPGEEG